MGKELKLYPMVQTLRKSQFRNNYNIFLSECTKNVEIGLQKAFTQMALSLLQMDYISTKVNRKEKLQIPVQRYFDVQLCQKY